MLSDEEKKAIEELWHFDCAYNREIKIVLNLIEKQSKEIEEAEQKEKKAYIDGTNVAHELCNKMWKNKIKAKIEELEKEIITGAKKTDIIRRAIVYELQSLLEKE